MSMFHQTTLDHAFAALKGDLVREGGPQISTMRNYRFAIVPYLPKDEYLLRQKVHGLTQFLSAAGWVVTTVDLQHLFLERLRGLEDDTLKAFINKERRLFKKDPERALSDLKDKVAPHIEGPEGIAADVSRVICDFARANPEKKERTLVFVGRAGALYPFFRTSALLKHIAGRTDNVPVVLLYPGIREEGNALRFMGELPADTDYRPRIYP